MKAVAGFALLIIVTSGCSVDNSEKSSDLKVHSLLGETSFHSQATGNQTTCDAGLQEFAASFHPLIRESTCVMCHGGSHDVAPPWASANVKESYARLKSYVDFSNIENSRLVIRAGNGHCNLPNDPICSDPEMQRRIAQAISVWWEKGESKCDGEHRRVKDIGIPKNISPAEFTKIDWDLATIDPVFAGLSLSAEIKSLSGNTPSGVAGYVLRKPRIMSTLQGVTLEVSGLRFYLNGSYQWHTNAYERIAAQVSAAESRNNQFIYPVLSSDMITMVGDAPTTDRIAVGIKNLAITEQKPCKAPAIFEKEIFPLLQSQQCMSCHGKDSADAPIPHMKGSASEICSDVRQYMSPNLLLLPILFDVPLKGKKLGHPKVSHLKPSTISKASRLWIHAEFE